MTKKRVQDIWNEITQKNSEVSGVVAHQFEQNIAQNPEGISADFEKFHLDETTTPKLFPPNKRD